ncbi:MAG: hypothetical protein U5L45_21685 [Saprospiraceae bacterium]|nr:hypothetical protein [Saprospiraceae bacterium]
MRHQKSALSHLQLLPLSDNKLDMFTVFNRDFPLITKWAELFYGHPNFETDIHAESKQADSLRHFYFEAKNQQKTRGQHTLGFGFPLLFDKDREGGQIVAPLFIWYLTMKPHPTRRDSWLVGFDDNTAVTTNEYLIQHIRDKHNIDLAEHLNGYVQNRPFGYDGFAIFCQDLATRLQFPIENINPALRECPTEKLTAELCERGDIAWSGVLGLFPHAEGGLSEKSPESVDYQNFTWTAEHAHEFSVLPEDVFQRAALRTILRNKITVVEGGHGTGKTHLTANILLNALSNGQKTAVVADDLATLMQVQNEFVKLGLGNLTFLLKDVYHDKKLLLDVLRNEQFGKTIEFKEEGFKIALKQARRLLSKSDDSHAALDNPIFGADNFSEVVGRFLKSQKIVGRELLANHLNSSDYEFTKEEYDDLKAAATLCEASFKNVNTLKHPLSNLHPSAFADVELHTGQPHQNGVESAPKIDQQLAHSIYFKRDEMTHKLHEHIEKFKGLHHRCIAITDAYTQRLLNYYETHSTDLRDQLRHLKEAYSDYQFQYGADFESSNLLKVSGLYASSLFSDRSKNILTAKDEALRQYDKLEEIHQERRHFPHLFLKKSDRKDLKKLPINLETFELLLKGWRKALPATVQEELQRLNAKSAQHFDATLAVDIRQIETDLEDLLVQLNDAHLYTEPLTHKMLTLPKRMLFIEETIEKLEETQLNVRDFDTFFVWQKNWLGMPEKARRLVQALVKVKPSSWSAAFDSWYFYNTLVIHYQSNTLGNDALMGEMNAVEDRLRQLMPTQIAAMWSDRKKTAIKEMKDKNREGFKYFFHEKNQTHAKGKLLKDILRGSIPTLSEIYPVLLLTPQVATQVIEREGKEFDLVIFENAQNLDAEQVVPILRNTEGSVLMTEWADSDAVLPHSFAAKVKANGAAVVQLHFLHRALSDTTRRLNQSVFYQNMQLPYRQAATVQTVNVHFMEGKFGDKTRVNDVEVAEIAEILKEISATPFNTYPRIGVVTMTTEQRDAVTANLLNVVQKTLFGWEKIERLQRNGSHVYSVEELAGLQFDILVVSGTFSDFEKINLSKRSFRQLLNSFTQRLVWVNSISVAELQAKSENRDYEMPFLLANLLFLAGHIQENRPPQYQRIFQNLEHLYGTQNVPKDSIFVDEIAHALNMSLGNRRVRTQHKIGNQTFPLVIIPKSDDELAQPTVVRIDGRLAEGPYFNADWERRLLNDLKKTSVNVASVWSYNWWKNPAAEATALTTAISDFDKIFLPQIEIELEKILEEEKS